MKNFINEFGDMPPTCVISRIKSWARAEEGAVTVDWVVLTATMTVIGGIIVSMTVDGTTDVGVQIGQVLMDKSVTE